MHLTFKIQHDNLEGFVEYWSKRYSYELEEKYISNIGKPLTEESRLELFEWKNGTVLSQKKKASIVANYPLLFLGDQSDYLDHRMPGGAVWNIFYLHCLNQQEWPIFDQHTYRAMKYLQTGKISELGNTNKQKYKSYLDEYQPFWKQIKTEDLKRTDQALFAFGRFLKVTAQFA